MRTLTACFLGLAATGALAATDSIELQLPSNQVLPLIHDRARLSVGCFSSFAIGSESWEVDHIEFPSAPTLRRSPSLKKVTINANTSFDGHPLQLVLPVNTFLKKTSTLNSRFKGQNDYDLTPSAGLVFDFAIKSVTDEPDQLCATPSAVEPAFPGSDLMLGALKAELGEQCFPLKLDGLDRVLHGQATLTGRGLTASSDLATMAIRLEYDHPTANVTAWRNFVDSGAVTALGRSGDTFALSFDGGLLARVLRLRFEDSLSDPRLTIEDPGIQSQWPWVGLPFLNVFFDAQADVSECPNLIGVHPVTAGMLFSLSPGADGVHLSGTLDWNLVDSDVLLCGLSYAALGGHFGFMFDPLFMGILGHLSQSFSPSSENLPTECSMGPDHHFSCDFPLALPTLSAGAGSLKMITLGATALVRLGSELVITGTSSLTGPNAASPKAVIQDLDVHAGIFGGCSSLRAGYHGSFSATGTGRVCKTLQVKNDPLGVFFVKDLAAISKAPWSRDVVLGYGDTAAYFLSPYVSTLTVRTSGGGRTLSLGPVAELTAQEQQDLSADLIMAKVNCMRLQTGLFGIPGLFDPRWKIDPPYDLQARVRSNDPLLVRNAARVSLDAVTFEVLNRPARSPGLRYALPQQDVRVSATATIAFGSLGTVRVPVSTVVRGSFGGEELGQTGLVSGAFAAGTSAQFEVSSAAFPRAVAGVDFAVDLSPRNLALQGVLEVR